MWSRLHRLMRPQRSGMDPRVCASLRAASPWDDERVMHLLFRPDLAIGSKDKLLIFIPYHEHPLVAPQVSHFSQVPFRTMVKLWHSEHSLPV